MTRHGPTLALPVLLLCALPVRGQDVALAAYPAHVTLDSVRDRHRLVVVATDALGMQRDVTREAQVSASVAGVAAFDGTFVTPLSGGGTELAFTLGELEARVRVDVRDPDVDPPVSFRNDVVPVLTRAGCNAGACHGAADGKNGFGLSLFGYDPERDHRALTREYRGRRLSPADPAASLVLAKPTGAVRHKGGERLERDGPHVALLRRWIGEGARDDGKEARALVGLAVEPPELVLGRGQQVSLVVTATYADGSVRDVTDLAILSTSNEPTVRVADDGRATAGQRGEAHVLARFGFLAEVAQVIVVPDGAPSTEPGVEPRNALDEHVLGKLAKLRLSPAPLCDDATFVRRAFLDLIGRLPEVEEVRAFTADEHEDKRARLVDRLLERPEFADVLALLWAEVLRIEPDRLERKGALLYTQWLRESLAEGVPFDALVRRLLTASGSNFAVPEANYYVVSNDPKVLAENCAQVFLGIRLQCAQCHNHPFERWTMDDYYGFAAFFAQVGRKRGEDPRATVVFDAGSGEVRNARDGSRAVPRFLGGAVPEIAPGTDRRAVLAEWLTSSDNPWFARNVANRVWARLFGRGLVEPVDDVRVSNPASHPQLLTWLAERLTASGFDVRDLVRTICASWAWQAGALPDGAPARSFAGRAARRLGAEQLLRAIDQVTGVPTRLGGLPPGAPATQLATGDARHRLLDLFGRPRRESACACERRDEPTLGQVLHLINGDTVEEKLRSESGWLARRLASDPGDAEMLEELFLRAYARPPSAAERDHLLRVLGDAEDRTAAWQDLMWAVLNSKAFLFH